jgi:CBS domain-containing protein
MRADLLSALSRHGKEVSVSAVMQREFATADAHEMLDTALLRLNRKDGQPLPVVRDGLFIGLLTPDSVSELVLIQEALRQPGLA